MSRSRHAGCRCVRQLACRPGEVTWGRVVRIFSSTWTSPGHLRAPLRRRLQAGVVPDWRREPLRRSDRRYVRARLDGARPVARPDGPGVSAHHRAEPAQGSASAAARTVRRIGQRHTGRPSWCRVPRRAGVEHARSPQTVSGNSARRSPGFASLLHPQHVVRRDRVRARHQRCRGEVSYLTRPRRLEGANASGGAKGSPMGMIIGLVFGVMAALTWMASTRPDAERWYRLFVDGGMSRPD